MSALCIVTGDQIFSGLLVNLIQHHVTYVWVYLKYKAYKNDKVIYIDGNLQGLIKIQPDATVCR